MPSFCEVFGKVVKTLSFSKKKIKKTVGVVTLVPVACVQICVKMFTYSYRVTYDKLTLFQRWSWSNEHVNTLFCIYLS